MEKIGEDAFSHTDIEELVLPKSVKPYLVNLSKNTKVFHQPFNYKNGDNPIELVKFTIAQDCKNLKEVVFR